MNTMSTSPPKEKNINTFYLELFRFAHNGEYERALKTCNRLLNLAPKEEKAFHCKIVCSIQLTKFDEALQAILKNSELSSTLYFEKAYCQYRLNQPEDALLTIETAPELDNQLYELKAQVLYRLEKYKECYALYRDIMKNTNDDYDNERQANVSAVMAYVTPDINVAETKAKTYEICYNNAYQLINQGQFVEAERKLRVCEKMCRESFEEDGCTDDEIEQELGIIKVQLAFCFHKQGRNKEAQQIYTSILKAKLDDVGLTAVACNNAVVLNKDQNIFDSKKKMKSATQEILNHKLNSSQRKIISTNNCLLTYYTNQLESCRKQCEKLVEQWPETLMTATIIRALLLCREGKVKDAIELINQFHQTEQKPENKLLLQLIATHLLIAHDDRKKACDTLHNLGDYTYRPAVVGALVSLHVALGDETGAAKVFEDTVAWYTTNQVGQVDLGNMWLHAAEFHMRHGHPTVAAKSLEEILRQNPEDKRTIAKLIMAYVQCDTGKAKILSEKLPSLDDLCSSVDSDIETSTWIFGVKPIRSKADSSPGTPKNEKIRKKKQRKRRGKLPQLYNSDNTPDAERWLPKYERTGYRKKRDRRAKDVIKGSQGTSSGSTTSFDFSAKLAEKDNEECLDSNETLLKAGPGSNKRSQKKKKKGSKW